MSNIKERLDKIRVLIQEKDFLENKGLSNEVNIRIFNYSPSDEMLVRHFIEQLSSDQTLSCTLKVHNLYEIFLSICDEKRITSRIAQMEEKRGSDYLLNQLQSIVTNDMFVKHMQYENHKKGEDVLMLTGIGQVFPFMRIHALLDALQPHFTDIPILVMYPGKFNGSQVRLFNKLKPNSYYRAFTVIEEEKNNEN